jgi:hypothetical protein
MFVAKIIMAVLSSYIAWYYYQVPAMDKAGRRPLLLYPMIFMVIILAVITAAIKYQVS